MIVNISIPLIQKKYYPSEMFSYLELRWLLPGHRMYFVKARKYEYHSVVEHGTHCSFPAGRGCPPPPAQHLWHLIMESISSLFEPEKITR